MLLLLFTFAFVFVLQCKMVSIKRVTTPNDNPFVCFFYESKKPTPLLYFFVYEYCDNPCIETAQKRHFSAFLK